MEIEKDPLTERGVLSPLQKLEMTKLSSALVSKNKRYSYEMEDIPVVEKDVQVNNELLARIEVIINERCKEIEEKSAKKDLRLNELETELQLLKKSGNGKARPCNSASRVQRPRLGTKCTKDKVGRANTDGSTSATVPTNRSHSATRGPTRQETTSSIRSKSTSAPTSPAKRMGRQLPSSKPPKIMESSYSESDRSRTRDGVLARKDKDRRKVIPEIKPFKKVLSSRTNQDSLLDKRKKNSGAVTSTPKSERRAVVPSADRKSGDSVDSTASSTAGDSGDGNHSPAFLDVNDQGELNEIAVPETVCNCRIFETQLRKLAEEHEKLQAEYARLRAFLGERIWDESKITTVQNKPDPAAETDESPEITEADGSAPLTIYKQEIIRVREEILAIRRQKSEYDKRMEEINRHSIELQTENNFLQTELEDVSQQVVDLIERLDNVQKDCNEKTKNIVDLENQLSASEAHLHLVQEEAAASHRKATSLQSQIEKAQKSYSIILGQFKETETEAKEMKEFMQEERNTLSEAIADLEKEMMSKQSKIDHLLASMEVKNRSLKELQEQNDKYKQETQQLQMELENVKTIAKEMLLRQGAELSGTSVTLSQLTQKLEKTVKILNESKGLVDENTESLADIYIEKEANYGPGCRFQKFESKSSSFVADVLTAIRENKESEFQNGNHNFEKADDASKCDGHRDYSLSSEVPLAISSEHKPSNSADLDVDKNTVKDLKCLSDTLTHSVSKDADVLDGGKAGDIHSRTSLIGDLPKDMLVWTLVDQAKSVDHLLNRLVKLLSAVQQKHKTNLKDLRDQKSQIQHELSHQILQNKITIQELNAQLSFSTSQKDLVDIELQKTQADLITTKNTLQHLQTRFNEEIAFVDNLSDQHLENKKLLQQIQELQSLKNKLEAEKQEFCEQSKVALAKLSEMSTNNNPGAGFMSTAEVLQEKFDLKNEITQLKSKLGEKDNQIGELSAKLNKHKQIINANWKKAEDEVKRLDDLIDYVLEAINSIPDVVSSCEVLQKLWKKLGGDEYQQSISGN